MPLQSFVFLGGALAWKSYYGGFYWQSDGTGIPGNPGHGYRGTATARSNMLWERWPGSCDDAPQRVETCLFLRHPRSPLHVLLRQFVALYAP